jgi:hypothetical protein
MKHEPLVRGLAFALSLLAFGCATSNEAPPLQDGVYIARGVCFGEGECYRYWRAYQAVEIRERPDPASPVIATVAPDEWVEAIDGQYRFVPLRGVVHTATAAPPLAVGDVVYMLEPLGEGYYVLWHRGETLGHDWASGDDGEPITWDAQADAPADAILGWWVQLKLENGQVGWVRDPAFECMGQLQGSANCRD